MKGSPLFWRGWGYDRGCSGEKDRKRSHGDWLCNRYKREMRKELGKKSGKLQNPR